MTLAKKTVLCRQKCTAHEASKVNSFAVMSQNNAMTPRGVTARMFVPWPRGRRFDSRSVHYQV